ncbi:uncharacterized protein PRD47_017622 isoform 3-T3 [Ara ararauna]
MGTVRAPHNRGPSAGRGDEPGGRGALGGPGPIRLPAHRGCRGGAERRRLPAAGGGHGPGAARLPGLLRGAAPEPRAAAGVLHPREPRLCHAARWGRSLPAALETGPEDFGNGSCFQELHPGTPWPRVCCARDGPLQAGELLGWEQCRDRSPGYIHEQGCFSAFGRTLQQFVSLPGICSLVVLGIESFAMFFAFCLYYNFD